MHQAQGKADGREGNFPLPGEQHPKEDCWALRHPDDSDEFWTRCVGSPGRVDLKQVWGKDPWYGGGVYWGSSAHSAAILTVNGN